MIVKLHYKLHSKLMPVICTVNNICLGGFFSECNCHLIVRTPGNHNTFTNCVFKRAYYIQNGVYKIISTTICNIKRNQMVEWCVRHDHTS